MSRLVWDETGDRLYETGVSNGVLYIQNEDGTYQNGVAWNGLVSVSEKYTSDSHVKVYATESRYDTFYTYEDLSLTIQAYTYPREFEQCEGKLGLSHGIKLGLQKRKKFGFCYKSLVGNDVSGTDYAYKIHVVYGCFANPSDATYSTLNESSDTQTFSWDVTTTPVETEDDLQPTSIMTIDSRDMTPEQMHLIEDALFGSSGTDPHLIEPTEISSLIWEAGMTWSRIQEVVNDGTIQDYKKVGSTINIDEWSDGTNSYSMPWVVAEYEDSGNMILKSKYAIPTNGIEYDPPQAAYYTNAAKSAGSYSISIGEDYGGWEEKKSVYFATQASMAANDQICFDSLNSINDDPTNSATVSIYAKTGTSAKQTMTTSNNKHITLVETVLSWSAAQDESYIDKARGTVSADLHNTGKLSISNFIAIPSGSDTLYYRKTYLKTQAWSASYGAAFYNSSQEYISGFSNFAGGPSYTTGYSDNYYSASIPEGAAYVRFTILTDTTTYNNFNPKVTKSDSYTTTYNPTATILGTSYPHARNPSSSVVNCIDAIVNGSSSWSNSLLYNWLQPAGRTNSRTSFSRPNESGHFQNSGFLNGLSDELKSVIGLTSVTTYDAFAYVSGTLKQFDTSKQASMNAYIPSLSQIYSEELKPENTAIEYYKKLARSANNGGKFQRNISYSVLKEYALDNPSQAVTYRLRSSTGENASDTFAVDSTGKIVPLAAKESSYIVVFIRILKTT